MIAVRDPDFPTLETEDNVVTLVATDWACDKVWEVDQQSTVESASGFYADVSLGGFSKPVFCFRIRLDRLSGMMPLNFHISYVVVHSGGRNLLSLGDLSNTQTILSKFAKAAYLTLFSCHCSFA